jgi:hypothetical protein
VTDYLPVRDKEKRLANMEVTGVASLCKAISHLAEQS